MVSINNLSVFFTGNYLFDEVTFIINPKDRIGLVGKNGAGKSTLLKIIAGMQEPEKGVVSYPNEYTLGYLPQELRIESKKTIFDETMTAFHEAMTLDKNIKHITNEIASRTDYESFEYSKLIEKLTDLNDRFQIIGGNTMQADTEKVLLGLGFQPKDFTRSLQEFSGGWQMRVELAKILLQRPNVLLLDEPTNHLDIESIQWLEDYLIPYSGAIVLVSHDRAFLDNVTQRTIEISLGKIYDYKAPYSMYVEMRSERREMQQAAFDNQQKQIEQVEKFIEKFRYKATKAKQVQSRVKMLDKLDRVEVDDEDNTSIHFRFPPAPQSGKVVIEAEKITKKYGEKTILENLDFMVTKGEKIAFVGKNGEGKTTLSKIIVGELDFQGGIKFGHNVVLGYYAQNQAELLNPEKTVFETIDDVAVGDIRTKIKNILGSFLFGGEAMDKKVKVLSGGEKSRLAMAKLLLSPVNLLILDEPTNHLDMRTKDILKSALLQYDGTLIVVSHDRDFLEGLTDKLFEFKNRTIKEHIGDVYEFLEKRKLENLKELEQNKIIKNENAKIDSNSQNKLDWEQKKQLDKEIRKISAQIEKSEKEIEKLEFEIAEMDKKIQNSQEFAKEVSSPDFFKNYDKCKKRLSEIVEEWEILHLQIDELKK